MKRPHSMKKTPAVVHAKELWRRIRRSGRYWAKPRDGEAEYAMLARTRDTLIMHSTVKRRARMRVDQAQPRRGRRASNINGKMTPPVAPPAAAIPVARARRLRKKWPTDETAGVKMS